MKKILSIAALISGIILLMVSCSKKELDTNQLPSTSEVVLKAYGPRPVVRGGVLRFVGMNLDQVASVTIPGCSPITEIEVVTAGVPSEIRVTVPKEEAQVGNVVLTTKGGKTIETATPLSYIESIVLEKMTPATAYPGEVITLEGDYLNLIHEVVFTNKVHVSEKDFLSHDRYSIKVKVPAEAKTGKVGVGTIDETVTQDEDILAALNIVETKEELIVGTANGSLISTTAKAGSTVTVEGDHLSLTKSVRIGFQEVGSFTATDSKLTFVLSDDAADGDVLLVMASGVEVAVGTLTTVNPAVSAVSPKPIRPGADLTVTGTDLDLVKSVQVPCSNSEHEWVAFTLSDGALAFTVPDDATGAAIVLHKANGGTVEAEYELVKPTITEVTPLPVPAGEAFTVDGTDMDLVTAVHIDEQELTFEVVSDTQIKVNTTSSTLGGKLSVITANGSSIAFPTPITIDYGSVTQVVSLTDKAKPGETVTMTGSGFNAIEAIYIGDAKVTSYSKREDTEMVFVMPAVPVGTYTPRFILVSGEEENPVGVSITYEDEDAPEIRTIWKGNTDLGSWSGNVQLLVGEIGELPSGSILRITYSGAGTDPQFKICDINWSPLPGFNAIANEWGVVPVPAEGGVYDYPLTADDISAIQNNEASWGGRGMVIAGQQAIVTQVDIVVYPVKERVIWEGNTDFGSWAASVQLQVAEIGELPSGSILSITYSGSGTDPQFKICDINWSILPGFNAIANEWGVVPVPAEGGVYDYPLTADDINAIQNNEASWGGRGMVIAGQQAVVTKVAIK